MRMVKDLLQLDKRGVSIMVGYVLLIVIAIGLSIGVFAFLKNQSIELGKGPDFIYQQAKAVYDSGKAIPPQQAIERRRIQLGLSSVMAPDVKEVQTLLKNIGSEKKLKQ